MLTYGQKCGQGQRGTDEAHGHQEQVRQ
uniref:Uncharacterized protein n=1 Tax=Anguilla anguilla TaxID=7936 RepID=A0A0E9R9V1_ANGAN